MPLFPHERGTNRLETWKALQKTVDSSKGMILGRTQPAVRQTTTPLSENITPPPLTSLQLQQQQQRPDLSRLMQLQAAGGVPGGLPGLPPGFPGSALPGLPGHPAGLGGIPTSAASLLAGLPPSSSAASALMAAHMGVRMPAPPGLPNHQDLLKKEEEERERANSSKPPIATPGPPSDERNVSSS